MTPVFVLHVEDDEADRTLFSAAFKGAAPGIHFISVVDGAEAIDYLSGQGSYQDRARYPVPRAVLLDLKLPKISGLEVLEWIRRSSDHKDLPVFMLTSSSDPDDLKQAKALGVHQYLIKPVGLRGIREIAKHVAMLLSPPVRQVADGTPHGMS